MNSNLVLIYKILLFEFILSIYFMYFCNLLHKYYIIFLTFNFFNIMLNKIKSQFLIQIRRTNVLIKLICIFLIFLASVISNNIYSQTNKCLLIDKKALNYYTFEDINNMSLIKIKQLNYLYNKSFIIPDKFKNIINTKEIDIRNYSGYREKNKRVKVPLNINERASSEEYIILLSGSEVRHKFKDIEQNLYNINSKITDKRFEKGGIFEGFTPEKEVLSKRNLTSKTFKNDNGSFTFFGNAGGALHYKDKNGLWQNIYTDFVKKQKKYTCDKIQVPVNMPVTYNPNTGFTSNFDGAILHQWKNYKIVALDEQGNTKLISEISNINGICNKNEIKYKSSSETEDIFTLGADRLEHNIIIQKSILNNVSSESYLGFQETIELPKNWTVWTFKDYKPGKQITSHIWIDSDLAIVDEKGTVVVSFPQPFIEETIPDTTVVWSRKDNAYIAVPVYDNTTGRYFVELNGNNLNITTAVSCSWLLKNNIGYPVTLDPTNDFYPVFSSYWTGYVCGEDTSKGSGNILSTYSWGITHGFSMYDVSSIPDNSTVNNVDIYLNLYNHGGTYCAYNDNSYLAHDPTSATGLQLWNDITTGARYNEYWCIDTPYTYKNTILGGNANSDMQASINGDNRFKVGHEYTDDSPYYSYFRGFNTSGKEPYVKVNYEYNIPHTVIYTCDDVFYDTGGALGNYENNEDYTITYCFASVNSTCIRAVISYYEIESDLDSLSIYDGISTSDPLLATLTGSSTNPSVQYTLDDNGTAYYAQSGCITFRFYSDGAIIDQGWKIKIDCPDNCVAPAYSPSDTASDNCDTYTPICNLNGYYGNTSSSYTDDHTELNIDSLGIFCGTIENNSWLSFIADSTTAVLDVWVSNCTGIPPLGKIHGIQIQIYETDCSYGNFTPKSNCWSPNKEADGEITATGLTPGNPYVIMIDGWGADHCDYVFSASMGVNAANAGPDKTICEGNTASLTASGGVTYSWSALPADPSLSGQESEQTINVSPVQTTTYSATVTGINIYCLSAIDDAVITVNPIPLGHYQNPELASCGGLYSRSNTDICLVNAVTSYDCIGWDESGKDYWFSINMTAGQVLDVQQVSSSVDFNYFITNSSGSGSCYNGAYGGSGVTAAINSTDNYFVSCDGYNGASGNFTIKINCINPPISASAVPSSICYDSGDTVMLTCSGGGGTGTTVFWYSGACNGTLIGTGDTITVNPTLTTTYYCNYGINGEHTSCASVTATVNPLPIADAGTDINIPNGTHTILYGDASGGSGGPYSYHWEPADSLVNSDEQNPTTVDLTTSTIFTLFVTDGAGCQGTDQVTVTITGGPLSVIASANPPSICEGDATQLNALASGGSGTYTYSWSSNPPGFNSAIADPIVSPTVTTTYSVTVDDGSNTASDNVTVTVNPLPVITFSLQSDVCENAGPIELTATPSGGTFSGAGVTGNYFDPTGIVGGPYTITYTYTDANGCTNSKTQDIAVFSSPDVSFDVLSDVCDNIPAFTLTGGHPDGGTYLGNGVNNNIFNPETAGPGIHTITYTYTDVNGCTDSCTQNISVLNSPNVTFDPLSNVCDNTQAFTLTGGLPDGGTYSGDGTDNGIFDPEISGPGTYTITYTYTDMTTSCSDTITQNISVISSPVITLTNDLTNDFAYQGQSITFTANPAAYDNYEFFVNSSSVQNGASNVYITNTIQDGDTVSVIATEDICESVKDEMIIAVKPIPNAFTPDGDGVNDIFIKGFKELDLTIVNRWGQRLYKGSDGWDGKYNGKYVSPGTYYYVIIIKDNEDNEIKLNGPVTVIR